MEENEQTIVPTVMDRWLNKLSWMTVERHQHLLAATARRHATDVSEKVRDAKIDSYAKGKEAGDQEGYERGIEEGRKEGRLRERAEQAEAARIQAESEARRRQQEAAERARWLVDEKPIGIDARMADEIRRDVLARTGQDARPKQWEMILSNDPATYVVAGAGSGKSTSLVLRVIALNLYRGIDRRHISVFTFTRESRRDFIAKLQKRMSQWGEDLSLDEARGIVRTFHSMVLRMARSSIDPSLPVLELLDKEKDGPVRDIEVDNLLAVGADPLSDEKDGVSTPANAVFVASEGIASDDGEQRRTPTERDRFLREAYEKAFTADPEFAAAIAAIYRRSLYQTRRSKEDVKKSLFDLVTEHDAVFSAQVEKVWREKIAPAAWPMAGITPVVEPVQLSSAKKHLFHVHGYVAELGAYVILGGAEYFKGMVSGSQPLGMLVNSKRKLLAAYSEKPIVWIDTVDELAELNTLLTWQKAYLEKRVTVPMFKWIAPGDRKRKPVLDTFYELAQFVENLGLPVARTLSLAAEGAKAAGLTEPEQLLAQAVSRFWPRFESQLEERGVWTFSQLFAHFSEDRPQNFESVPTFVLGAMQHLLIDEFQDISPQIVKWVRGCQRELVKRGLGGSLTCVGDDWQSIYGWRGSSPDFFVRFKNHFPAVSHGYVKLEENFRSSDHILRCAESVLVGVPGMEWKTCKAKSEWADETTPVLVHETDDKLPYDALRKLLSSEVKRTGATQDDPILVLARSARGHYELSSKSRRTAWGKAVKFMTFHAAKGLEARSVVLLQDCAYASVNPLKNFLYGHAGFGSYDAAQHAEARRLAYVGITRAMERCYWFARKEPGGALASIPMGRPFVARCDTEGNPAIQVVPPL
jgi:superfamily I DNA/RNA helicase